MSRKMVHDKKPRMDTIRAQPELFDEIDNFADKYNASRNLTYKVAIKQGLKNKEEMDAEMEKIRDTNTHRKRG